MGKRQRHTDFIETPADEIERIAKDRREPTERRMKAVAELKFRKLRNIKKRSK